MSKSIIIITTIVAMFSMVALSRAEDVVSHTLSNSWIFLPASGNPVSYEIRKLVEGANDFTTLESDYPATTVEYTGSLENYVGKLVVRFTHVSETDESYRLQVRAKRDGLYGGWVESDKLIIDTRPGKPIIEGGQ